MKIAENTSITFNGETLSSSDFESLGSILEHNITLSNIEPGDIVAIALRRSYWSIAAMYTLYRLGIPYLLINCDLPESRISYMLETVKVKCIMTDQQTDPMFRDYKTIMVDELAEGALKIEPFKSDIMYLAFTSGSTGKPKAIAISREAFDYFADAFLKSGALDGITTSVCTTDFGFDIIYCETFLPMMAGVNIILANEEEVANVRKRCALIKENHVEYMQCTPSALMIMKMDDEKMSFLDGIKTLILGGEALPENLLLMLSKVEHIKLMNFYGPTETTVWASYSDLTGEKTVNIGKPLANAAIYILDEDMAPVSDGEIGEICIGGKSLANGYYNNPEATEKAFVYYNGERIYKTGDLGHIENGIIFCHNRKDFQVKIRGHRIELGEIDSHIMNVKGVKRSVTTTLQSEIGAELICFYIADDYVDEKQIRLEISQFLPDYMIPSVLVKRQTFIYTANGKTDCQAMVNEYKEVVQKDHSAKDYFTNSEESILTEITDFIRGHNLSACEEINADTKMKTLNINSVGYVSLIVYFEDKYDFEFDEDYLNAFAFKTVGKMADYICENLHSDD